MIRDVPDPPFWPNALQLEGYRARLAAGTGGELAGMVSKDGMSHRYDDNLHCVVDVVGIIDREIPRHIAPETGWRYVASACMRRPTSSERTSGAADTPISFKRVSGIHRLGGIRPSPGVGAPERPSSPDSVAPPLARQLDAEFRKASGDREKALAQALAQNCSQTRHLPY